MTIEQCLFFAKELSVHNKLEITKILRRSPPTPLAYSDRKTAADVPADSFDMTRTAFLHNGRVLTAGDGYRPVMVGHANQRKPARDEHLRVLRALRGVTPAFGQGGGETLEGIHRRAIAP
jgi:hypothetical protein